MSHGLDTSPPTNQTFDLPPANDHPAKFSTELLPVLVEELTRPIPDARPVRSVLDPFAGTGRIHAVADAAGIERSVGVELEPEWANLDVFPAEPRLQIVGDCRVVLAAMAARGDTVDAIGTSPAYGNRMADTHNAQDACKRCAGTGVRNGDPLLRCTQCKGAGLSRRNTYRHRLGRPLTDGNAGGLQWGPAYRELHTEVWARCVEVLAPGGRFVVNVSNFVRNFDEIDVVSWHLGVLGQLGLRRERDRPVLTRRQRNGSNSNLRVAAEVVAVFVKPEVAS